MAEQTPFSDVNFATNPEPRCPCVLLLDVSGSMNEVVSGSSRDLGYEKFVDGKTYRVVEGGITKLHLLNEGIRALQADLLQDSLAAQRVELSIITFGGQVQTLMPFTEVSNAIVPSLQADGETPMGEAIFEAINAIATRKEQFRRAGLPYYRPWIFLITDGEPTDYRWQAAADAIREGERTKKFAFFAVGVDNADRQMLKQISSEREPLMLKETRFKEMFVWLSQSLKSVSHSNPGEEGGVKFQSPSGWAGL